jgi:DNA polymerase-1
MFLWKQVLMGDSVDGYSGLPGIGEKGAEEVIDDAETLWKLSDKTKRFQDFLWDYIVEIYEDFGFNEEGAIAQARCARILTADLFNFETSEHKTWQPYNRL